MDSASDLTRPTLDNLKIGAGPVIAPLVQVVEVPPMKDVGLRRRWVGIDPKVESSPKVD